MLRHCLYCGRKLAHDEGLEHLRRGVRVSFDPARERVWSVCDRCHGWSLWPDDTSHEALPRLERDATDRAHLLYQTDNVALLEATGRELIRIGRTELPEEAWWRYGRQLRRRRAAYHSRLSMLGAATYAAVSYIGSNLGLSGITGDFYPPDDLYADIIRWRWFGRTAWAGRAPCPQCHSVLIRLFFYRTRFLILLPSAERGPSIALPCSRCDPWTVDKVHRLDGAAAEQVLRRVLAYHNVQGASQDELADAIRLIETAGSAENLVSGLAAERRSLFGLGRIRRLALEISVNANVERRRLAGEVAELEAGWRQADDIAQIIEEELA
ncbi:MAG: hypothetical protein JSV86_21820 [Gemmatimonadota bacterium]|nr:MAG: hypothetical protein JSV86_21820 [Gemmatimonadota bacterium]